MDLSNFVFSNEILKCIQRSKYKNQSKKSMIKFSI